MAWTLVTGASDGIGAEFARLAARKGRDVIVTARSVDKLEALAEEMRGQDVDVVVIPADLSKPGAADLLWEKATDGREVDILVNNAGLGYNGPFDNAEGWAREEATLAVNVVAATRMVKLAVPHMKGHGAPSRIINVASLAGFMPGPGFAIYHASKAFLLSLSEAVAVELKDSKVTVTALCPGPTASGFFEAADMHDLPLLKAGPIATAKSVAEAGWNAAVTGRRIEVPGGMNKLTALMPKFLPRGVITGIAARLMAHPSR